MMGSAQTQAGRSRGQLMSIEQWQKFPVVVRRRTCTLVDDYLGCLPDNPIEIKEYLETTGHDRGDIYLERWKARAS